MDGLASAYDVYDILMRYWQDAMQDDCYLISREGWKVELSAEVMLTDKKSKEVKFVAKKNPTYRDYTCDLLPVNIVVARYFQAEEDAVKHAEELVAQLSAKVEQLEEEYPDTLDDTAAGLKKTLKELQYSDPNNEDVAVIKQYFVKCDALKAAKKQTKEAIAKLTKLVVEKYPLLTVDEIKDMVINVKWHTAIVGGAINEAWRVTYGIEEQITALVSRYERRLTDIEQSVGDLEKRVSAHLAKMGF